MFKIRDAAFRVIGVAVSLPAVLGRPGIERIDIWPAGSLAQVGITWADGASTIGDAEMSPAQVEREWQRIDTEGRISLTHH